MTTEIGKNTLSRGFPLALLLITLLFAAPLRASPEESGYFTVRGDKTYLNGQNILVKGLRCSNALISDRSATELISNLDTFTSYGINIGLYNEEMKANQKAITAEHFRNGWGYMCASTWLQCAPPYGPNNSPGGNGSKNSPGIEWWLEYIRKTYGPYVPSITKSETEP